MTVLLMTLAGLVAGYVLGRVHAEQRAIEALREAERRRTWRETPGWDGNAYRAVRPQEPR